MSKHTPGEWWFRRGEVLAPVLDGDEYGKQCVEHGYGGHLVAESVVGEANGRLIAAAPELLAACEALIAVLDGGLRLSDVRRALAMARKAVKKAGGVSDDARAT